MSPDEIELLIQQRNHYYAALQRIAESEYVGTRTVESHAAYLALKSAPTEIVLLPYEHT